MNLPSLTAPARAPNPIHAGRCDASIAWSTMNAGEALPGIVTPLTWSIYGDGVERAMRGAFADLGVLREAERVAPAGPETRLWDLFYGRAAGNLSTFRALADRMPGTNGDAVEQQIFGQVRPGMQNHPDRRRYPVIALKMPAAAARVAAHLRAAAGDIDPWWQHAVGPGRPTSAPAAQALLRDAVARFEAVMRPHTLAAMLCQALYEQVRVAAERAGRPGLEISLVTGYGDMAETAVVSDLWAVSRDRLTIEEFVGRHGYHGPNEGELAARIWRMDRAPLERLLVAYREMDDDRDPRRVEAGRGVERRRAEAELLGALHRTRRPATRLLLKIAARLIPLRGTGKAAFLRCSDVARAAARVYGEALVRDGTLDSPEDVFMLTVQEITAPVLPAGIGEAVAARRAIHDEYRTIDVPDLWQGVPEPFALEPAGGERTEGTVAGTPVSPGVVEGVVKLILDPESDDELDPGEILVCRTTDPSWASLMMVASALVIDIGGPISHGAIVARELGIPCVVGTRTGTARLRTGDRVRVDGERGDVVILERAAP